MERLKEANDWFGKFGRPSPAAAQRIAKTGVDDTSAIDRFFSQQVYGNPSDSSPNPRTAAAGTELVQRRRNYTSTISGKTAEGKIRPKSGEDYLRKVQSNPKYVGKRIYEMTSNIRKSLSDTYKGSII